MPLPLALLAAPAIAKFALGAYQTYQSNKALKNLGEMPAYTISPELEKSYTRAERMANQGYTPQERAAFTNRMARGSNAAYNRALTVGGGGISQAVNAANLANNINANLDFTAGDARLRRENMRYADSIGGQVSNQRNRDTAQKLAYRMLLEQNYGAAKRTGIDNMFSSVSGLPYAFMQNEYLNMLNQQPGQESISIGETPLAMKQPSLSPVGMNGLPVKTSTDLITPTFGVSKMRQSPLYRTY